MVTNIHFVGDDGSSLPVEVGLKKIPVDAQRSLSAILKTEVSHILQNSYKEKHIVFCESSTLTRNATIGTQVPPLE